MQHLPGSQLPADIIIRLERKEDIQQEDDKIKKDIKPENKNKIKEVDNFQETEVYHAFRSHSLEDFILQIHQFPPLKKLAEKQRTDPMYSNIISGLEGK